MKKYEIGQLLYNVYCKDDLKTRHQQITCHIDGGYLEDDNIVCSINGTIVDYLDKNLWFDSKNEAIDEAIRQLTDMKD